ncbi:PepSY domain-containing protein [Mucilaginibacter paludis]|uniref:Flavodoxin/nitric oxide synthase n=1 Tax=Mucilaginibacter paludis DSM 18603 TaxID=714943 RepID=H1YG34_9SPHI|nr:PepSY domain-containing protein [Mucilaginibacter paludis]EHQ26322.1 flavodoxin/nitric oxide synthase [Mucilaginibacter paludis DSM 18603]
MTISIWRYSHLALAVSSFILLTLAAVTGVILAFQPVAEKLQPYRADNINQITLAQSIPVLRKMYPGISQLTVDANHFVQVKGSDAQGKKLLAFIDPQNGAILGTPGKKSDFFEWVTALHRSLFLHETGRFFIGLTAFLLLLITISGTALIIQRQRGLKRFFTRIARDNFAQYYHVVLGRWSLIPIFIIALSGTYLSLARFGLIGTPEKSPKIDFAAIRMKPLKNASDFDVFKQTKLSEVESIEFPFSEDAEDYYTLKLKIGEVAVNQVTGDILSEVKYPTAVLLTNLSLNLHTGRASGIWAIILAVASANILFFIYSGFAITWKRLSNRTKNKYKANESRFVILVGSENGSTFGFAKTVQKQLLKAGERSIIVELDRYTVFPEAEHFLILTATYGLGDAPTNARRFTDLLQQHPQPKAIKYAVLGFGSHAYPDFCKFAFEVNYLLSQQAWAKPLIDIHTVNDKSPDDFALWAEAWSQQAGIKLDVTTQANPVKHRDMQQLTVTTINHTNDTNGVFTVTLKPKRKVIVTSGDLLAIYPTGDYHERLYSIGIINEEIHLSVRLYPGGLGSGFLHSLKAGNIINARIVNNSHFYFPVKAPEVIMISNGTGIAPFLGMINQNIQKKPCHLYCGFRDSSSYQLYQNLLEESHADGKLSKLHTAFSREDPKQYVGHLLATDTDLIADVLNNDGVVMICGSLSMQKDVMELLETVCQTKTDNDLSFYQSHDRIRSDCY